MSIECEHGQLARSCNICEYERTIAELKQEIEAKDEALKGGAPFVAWATLPLKERIATLEAERDKLTARLEEIEDSYGSGYPEDY